MDKVICDICATQYSQTADECPICGYPRQASEKAAAGLSAASATRERVKGGRFSNKNVKKRNQAARSARDTDEIVIAPALNSTPAAADVPPADANAETIVLPVADVAAADDAASAVAAAVAVAVSETLADEPNPDPAPAPAQAPAPAADEAPVDTDDADEDDTTAAIAAAISGAMGTAALDDDADGTPADDDSAAKDAADAAPDEEPERDPNKPLLIVIGVLLAAIVMVSVYIGVRFFRGAQPKDEPAQTTTAATSQPTETTAVATEPDEIACAAVSLERGDVTLAGSGETYQLNVNTVPADTTDPVTYLSSDASVVTVSDDGLITAVGAGRANVIVACGDARVVCSVYCDFAEETTEPAETTEPTETTEATQTAETTEPVNSQTDGVLTLSHSDVSLFTKGESFTITVKLGDQTVKRADVTWSTSSASVATVENGVVTAAASGTAEITAEYQGKKAVCTVRCRIADEETEPTETTGETEPTESAESAWSISHEDVTLAMDESFTLTIRNSAGQRADVTWSASKDGVVTISGSKITAVGSGVVTVSALYEGVTYSCIVRVS